MDEAPELKAVSNKAFGPDELVVIDGCVFHNCHFNRCVLVFRGGPYEFDQCQLTSPKYQFEEQAARSVVLASRLADEFPELRDKLFPNWKKWKQETIH
jgi:hypothetical protein